MTDRIYRARLDGMGSPADSEPERRGSTVLPGALCCCVVVGSLVHTALGWYPFFYDWAGLYEAGVIDGSEWKANRFRFL